MILFNKIQQAKRKRKKEKKFVGFEPATGMIEKCLANLAIASDWNKLGNIRFLWPLCLQHSGSHFDVVQCLSLLISQH